MTHETPDKMNGGNANSEARSRSQLIAAYHDDELTQRQRLEVEGLLEADASAKAELADLREISASFKRFAKPTLPTDAFKAVRAEIGEIEDRTVLLRISGWAAGLAAMLLISCGLLLGAGVTEAKASPTQPNPFVEASTLLHLQATTDISEAELPVEAHLSDLIATELLARDAGFTAEGS